MTKEKLRDILDNLHIKTNVWTELYEIEGIVLNSGKGIYPNWAHMRFLITDNMEILIRYGSSEPYGARLTYSNNISFDGLSVRLNTADLIQDSVFYPGFRYPIAGDVLRLTKGTTSCLAESIITHVSINSNCTCLELARPIPTNTHGRLSFYNPIEYNEETCMHSNPVEGVYMKFLPNRLQNTKKYGGFHEIIKCKEIEEITLKVLSKRNQKTYTIK